MSLSRRYRPKTFADITDQTAIKETLRKEVATGNIGHAYLFAGPRGVGKTTSARIFAKALNCQEPKDGEPCNACAACEEANAGRMLEIIEMDAASNTGVDNVREAIVEHVRFAPAGKKYKVYILDEAHMLSTSAWNALLKTLEEPPSYAVFILATTEKHKVPATILSRCQQFDFKRVTQKELEERVKWLATQEKTKIADAVVTTIATRADGCVRDAETLLDQVMALGESNVTEEVASLVLPVSRLPLAAKLLSVCAARTLGPALAEVAKLEDEGIPIAPLFDDCVLAVRNLLLAADDASHRERLQKGDEGERAVAALVGSYTPAELADMALLFMERRRDARHGVDPRFALELAVTAIALGVLPHGPGSSPQGQVVASHVAAPVESMHHATHHAPRITQQGSELSEPKSSTISPSVPKTEHLTLSTEHSQGPGIALSDVQRIWSKFIRLVGQKNPSLTFILSLSRPHDASGKTVTIRFQYAYHQEKIIADGKARRVVSDALAETLGIQSVTIEGVVGEDAERAEKRSDDMVGNILRAFGGQVVDEQTPSG